MRRHRQRKHVRGIQIVIPLVHNCSIGKESHPVDSGSVGLVDVAEEVQAGTNGVDPFEQFL